jgi:hypothetical protein
MARIFAPGSNSSVIWPYAFNSIASVTHPIFEGFGRSPVAGGIASVLVSLIPYEHVKFASRRRQVEEDLELELLLQQQKLQQQQVKVKPPLGFWTEVSNDDDDDASQTKGSIISGSRNMASTKTASSSAELMSLVPALEQKESLSVEKFADIIKWLEYTVLNKQYGGELGLYPVLEGARFGSELANVHGSCSALVLVPRARPNANNYSRERQPRKMVDRVRVSMHFDIGLVWRVPTDAISCPIVHRHTLDGLV